MNVQPQSSGTHAFTNGASSHLADISSMVRLSAEMHPQAVFQQPQIHNAPAAIVASSNTGGAVCPICRSEFSKESGLKRHMRVHNRPTAPLPIRLQYACRSCHIPFSNSVDLNNHMEMIHGVYGSQVQKCAQCGCFRPVSAMSSTNPFRCDNCSHMNQQPSNGFQGNYGNVQPSHTSIDRPTFAMNQFNDQKTTNTVSPTTSEETKSSPNLIKSLKEKAHKCPSCPKSFAHANTLSLHKKTHTGEYKDICEYCDKTFFLHDYYIRHLRVHTKEKPYTCDVCDKSFSQSNTLTQHKRTHTGEKPYTCDDCGKSFGVRDYLNKHRRVHTGEKPYECDVCSKRYSQASALRSHKLQHSHFT